MNEPLFRIGEEVIVQSDTPSLSHINQKTFKVIDVWKKDDVCKILQSEFKRVHGVEVRITFPKASAKYWYEIGVERSFHFGEDRYEISSFPVVGESALRKKHKPSELGFDELMTHLDTEQVSDV